MICEGKDTIKRLAESKKRDLKGANLRGANLLGANLRGADLMEANLRGAKIEFYQFPSVRLLSSMPLKNISDEIILELMRWDAQAHPKPELFDVWAKGRELSLPK